MSFQQPWALLLLALPLLTLLRRTPDVPVLSAPWSWQERPTPWTARLLWRVPGWVTALAVAAFVVASASPVREEPRPIPPEASVSVMVALDVSGSMTDGSNPPLERATQALESLLDRSPGFRVGLVTFAGTALTRLPPTQDETLFSVVLRNAQVGLSDEGTALGTAIGLAGQRLAAGEAFGRAIILLTDGMSNTGALDPTTAASLAAESGAAVHAVLLRDIPSEGEAILEEVVRAGGGRLVRSDEADDLLSTLRELVPPRGTPGPPVYVALWMPFLLGGTVLLGLGETLRFWKGRVGR